LRDQQGDHTEHAKKAEIVFNYFVGLIGKEDESNLNFIFQRIFHIEDQIGDLDRLTELISEQEVDSVIHEWYTDKAPDSDGFSGELYKAFKELHIRD
jgi:hypothetical protein